MSGDGGPRLRRGHLAHAAALIAGITVLARLAGFGRTAVFGRSVGATCVGDVYTTANTIPNIIFDVVAGGTLSALVVPILAPTLVGQGRRMASRVVSALLSWAALILVVVAVLIVVLAGPITHVLLGNAQCPGAQALGTRMLIVFAPQVVFYGLGVVLGGALQAAERFSWPALAPLLSSLTVIVAYLVYGRLAGAGRTAVGLSRTDELVLSVGTTVGVFVLAGSLIPAALRLGIHFRPTLRFPAGLGPTVRQAALAGGATLGAQQIATAVMLTLANAGGEGTAVIVTFAQTVFLLPWAVLAVPIATSAYPRLAAAWDAGERDRAADLAALALKAVAALAAIGTAALIAASGEIARVMLNPGTPAHHGFGPSIAAFAVGLLGWSLVALLARVLYAARRVPLAAGAQIAGWLVAISADVVLSAAFGSRARAVVLAAGNSIGVSVAAGLLLLAAWRAGVLKALAAPGLDCGRAAVAAAAGAAVGWGLGHLLGPSGVVASLLVGALAGVVGGGVAALTLAVADPSIVASLRQMRHPEQVVG